MQLIAYLDFDGQCREAFDFYAEVLRGRIASRFNYGDSPMAGQTPPEAHGRIMHSMLEADGAVLMGADAPPGNPTNRGCVNIQVTDPEEAERIFAALSEGGQVQMPIAETFWALRFGLFTDRYGKGWMVNCLKPMP